jgi:hypothetical protein
MLLVLVIKSIVMYPQDNHKCTSNRQEIKLEKTPPVVPVQLLPNRLR